MDTAAAANHIRRIAYAPDEKDHLLMVLASFAVLLFVLVFMSGTAEQDVINFFAHSEAIKSGQMPYRDFVFEFPPFSLVFFIIPGLFASDLETYALLFGLEVVVFIAVTLHFTLLICEHIGANKLAVAFVFTMFFVIYFPIRKFDIFPACATVIALYFFMERRFGLAYGFAAFATLTKIYPALIIVLFLMLNVLEKSDGKGRNIAIGASACIAVSVMAVAPLMLAGVPFADCLGFIGFHADRGFQVESLFAEFVRVLTVLGLTTSSIVPAHDTHDVVGPLCDAVVPYWTAVVVIGIGAMFIVAARFVIRNSGRLTAGWSDRSLILMATVIILMFMMTNKVFSTQYMVWIMPMLALIPMMAKDAGMRVAACVIVLLSVDFGRYFLAYPNDTDLYLIFNLFRDVALVAILCICLRALARSGSKDAALDTGIADPVPVNEIQAS